MNGLSGKVALVSAASSGIGKGIARVMSSHGCRVHIFSRNEEKIRKTAEEISKATGNTVNYSTGDMSKPSDVRRVMSEVKGKTGEIDFLLINYGDPKVAPFMEISEDDWDKSINMILKSSVIMLRESIGHLAESKGRIVFVTSLTTKQPMVNFGISASLRAAVVSLSKVLSLEYASSGLTTNSISQGYIMTPRLESIAETNSKKFNITLDEAYERLSSTIPAGRFGKPEEVGNLAAFLCSDEASYINGTNIQIDGGLVKFPF